MRRELTAISVFSTAIAFSAGFVLCMQISQLNFQLGPEIPGPVLSAVEAAIFGTAIYAWQQRVTIIGWIMGIAGLALVRAAVTSAAAVTIALMQGAGDVATGLEETTELAPRACAVVFALMSAYPLRPLLPVRRQRIRDRRSFAESAAVKSAEGDAGSADRGLLIVTVKDRNKERRRETEPPPPPEPAVPRPAVEIEGVVRLPLREVLTRMPAGVVSERGRAVDDTLTMEIPLEEVHPQLKEARVTFTVAELRQWLPPAGRKAVRAAAGADPEKESEQVELPLDLIVPQLPEGALALPEPSPPDWAKVEQGEPIVFATTD